MVEVCVEKCSNRCNEYSDWLMIEVTMSLIHKYTTKGKFSKLIFLILIKPLHIFIIKKDMKIWNCQRVKST